MIKLIQLIYINLLSLLDFNKINVAKQNGVKSNSSKKLILTFVIAIIYGYIICQMILNFGNNLSDKYLIFEIAYLTSFFICFLLNLFFIEPICFKSDDNELLFSLPINKIQIISSKLFNVYLRNLFFVIVIMLSATLVYLGLVGTILDEVVLMIIISSLLVPIIPLIVATLISFLDGYLKIKLENKVCYNILKFLCTIIFIGLLFIYIVGFDMKLGNIGTALFKLECLCPLVFIFMNAIRTSNLISFFLLVILSCFVMYIYTMVLSDKYNKICSMLKGVKKKNSFVYNRVGNFGRIFGLIRKEFIYLFNNKTYLFNSIGNGIVFSILFLIICMFVSVDNYLKNELFLAYFNMFFPMILSILSSINVSTINSISLEQKRIDYLMTIPINMALVLFSKWIVNIILGSFFVLLNGIVVLVFLDLSKYLTIMSFILPFVALMLTSLTSLLLDFIFPMKDEMNENVIIKGRILSFVPMFLALIIGIAPIFLMRVNLKYMYFQIGYILILFMIMVIEIIYMFIFRKKIIKKLFS